MDALHRSYLLVLRLFTMMVVLAALFAPAVLNDDRLKLAQRYAVPTVSILFLGVELAARRRIWKFLQPRLDLDGDWLGTTTYTQREVSCEESSHQHFAPWCVRHRVRIRQESHRIEVLPTDGDPFVKWNSIAADLSENGTLSMAYEVTYKPGRPAGEEPFADEARGVEIMRIVEYAGERPIRMAGAFWHCALGKYPVYRGTVEYVRVVSTSPPPAAAGAAGAMAPAPSGLANAATPSNGQLSGVQR